MRSTFLDFSPPWIGEEEVAEVADTLRSGWITTGPRVKRFEEAFAAFLGAPGAVALNSGTAALHVALVSAGIGPGDVVITTPMTFCSSVHVIEHVGARPLLVDVEPDTLNLDLAQVDRAIEARGRSAGRHRGGPEGRVRAILPVHLYGHPCDMDAILTIGREHELVIIEDAAHALPAKYNGRTIGSNSEGATPLRFACFSFHATKNLTTGEGGMLVPPPELLEEARAWGLHGMNRDAYKRYAADGSWSYEVVRPGFKYNMTDIQAAIGLHQLTKLPEFHRRRREIARRYDDAFRRYEELQTPVERQVVEHAWHLYTLRLNVDCFRSVASGTPRSAVRDRFIEQLKARNIGASVHFIPIHLHAYYRQKYGYKPQDFPVAFDAYERILSLPLYPRMTDGDVEDVILAVQDVVESCGR
jgi:dTDP-4-amino-4,6-dideoxygalactose transaminase